MHKKMYVWQGGAFLFLCGLALWSLSTGTVHLPILGVIKSLGHAYGLTEPTLSPLDTSILWYIRLPRVLVAIIVGAALAMSGAVMQGVLGNSLADPGIMGISAGAALGAVIAIGFGLTSMSVYYLPMFALLGATAAILLALALTFRKGQQNMAVLLLAGVTVSMFCGALTSGILSFVNEYRLREFLFWTIGDLDYRQWFDVQLSFGPVIIGMIILLVLGRQMNILVLGDTVAKSLGMPVMFYRLLFLGIASFMTAVAVCVSGSIAFVGLMIPHAVRMIVGPDYRILFPASALGGSIFLLLCDTIGRSILPHQEIRVGIITALIGAPYFLFLLSRLRKRGRI